LPTPDLLRRRDLVRLVERIRKENKCNSRVIGTGGFANLLAPEVAHRYRNSILAPGGSKPADQLVRDFLGRPFDFKSWQEWLNRDEQ
jgi:hypothetical protein